MRRSYLLALALLCWTGCANDPMTEVVITVEAEAAIKQQSQTLSVRVVSDPYGAPRVVYDNSSTLWKDGAYTIALSPHDGDTGGQFRVEVVALKNGEPLGYARVVSGYLAGERRYLRLMIEAACALNPVCDANETCHQGRCAPAFIEPSTLGSDDSRVPSSVILIDTEAATVSDGGVPTVRADAGRDGGGFVFPAPSSDARVPTPARDASFVFPFFPTSDGSAGRPPAEAGSGFAGLFGDASFVFPGLATRDAGSATSACYTALVTETAAELATTMAERLKSNAAFCFAPEATWCSLVLGFWSSCDLPADGRHGGFTELSVFWSDTRATVSAGRPAADGGVVTTSVGTIEQLIPGLALYSVNATLPWLLKLPANVSTTTSQGATCSVTLESAPRGDPMHTASVQVCLL